MWFRFPVEMGAVIWLALAVWTIAEMPTTLQYLGFRV